jgi:hypothetical protein
MYETVNLDTLVACLAVFLVVLGFQLFTMKLRPALKGPETRSGRERDGDFECSGKRQSEFNKRIKALKAKKK